MFNKPPARPAGPRALTLTTPPASPGAPDAPVARRPAAKAASVIAEGMVIEGALTGEGELHIDGVVRGDIKVGRLTVGENGAVDGSVIAQAVECRGKISGSMSAKQVRLYGTAHVDGDITHEQLAMETGAFFQGRSLRLQTPPQTAPTPKAEPRPETSKVIEAKPAQEASAEPRPTEAKPAV